MNGANRADHADGPVDIEDHGPVVLIRMADQSGGNEFTPSLERGVREGFALAEGNPAARVVVLAGLPGVFSNGASVRHRELAVRGDASPHEFDGLVRAPARCCLPVISAMRGHAIGGGLLLGLYSDVSVLSERSVYSVPFLRHGIPPVQGVTHLLTERFGVLGGEMLMTARNYQGGELRDRRVSVPVVPYDEVESLAFEIASEISVITRPMLVSLKKRIGAALLAKSDDAMACDTAAFHLLATSTE